MTGTRAMANRPTGKMLVECQCQGNAPWIETRVRLETMRKQFIMNYKLLGYLLSAAMANCSA
jgi:hypothetical protein